MLFASEKQSLESATTLYDSLIVKIFKKDLLANAKLVLQQASQWACTHRMTCLPAAAFEAEEQTASTVYVDNLDEWPIRLTLCAFDVCFRRRYFVLSSPLQQEILL